MGRVKEKKKKEHVRVHKGKIEPPSPTEQPAEGEDRMEGRERMSEKKR